MSRLRIPRWIGTSTTGKHIVFPPDAVTQGFCALARRRSGKSVLAGVFEETLLARKQSFVVLDPAGSHWGIKYRTDQNGIPNGSSDFRVMVVGGEHGDVPLDLHGGKLLAQTVVSTDVSVVVDLSLTGVTERKRFVCDFSDELYIRNSTPRCLILEEAQEFVPQSPRWEEQKAVLGSVSRLITGGGGRGLGFFLISQRPALVNKDVLSQIDNMFVMRLMGPQDLDAVKDWFDANVGDKKRLKEIVDSLPQMQPGDAWLMSPDWMHDVTRMHVRMRATYHAGRTPKQGERPVNVKKFKLSRVVSDFKESLEKTLAERQSEVKDMNVAKARIRVLESELRDERRHARPNIIADTPKVLKVKPQKVKVTDSEIRAILQPMIQPFYEWQRLAEKAIVDYQHRMVTAVHKVGFELPEPPARIKHGEVKARLQEAQPKPLSPSEFRAKVANVFKVPEKLLSMKTEQQPTTNGDTKLNPGMMRILAAIVQSGGYGLAASQAKAHAGLKSAGTFRTYLSTLRVAGLVQEIMEQGNLRIVGTASGIKLCADSNLDPTPQTTEEVVRMWNASLNPGQKRILSILVEARGEPMGVDEVREQSGIQSPGTFRTYLSDLRQRELLVSPSKGQIAANKESLFL